MLIQQTINAQHEQSWSARIIKIFNIILLAAGLILSIAASFAFLQSVLPYELTIEDALRGGPAVYYYDEDGWSTYAMAIKRFLDGSTTVEEFMVAFREFPVGFELLTPFLLAALFFIMPVMPAQWLLNFAFHFAAMLVLWRTAKLYGFDSRIVTLFVTSYAVATSSVCFRFGDPLVNFALVLVFFTYSKWYKQGSSLAWIVIAELLMVFTRAKTWPMIAFPCVAYLIASPFVYGSGRSKAFIQLLFCTLFLPVVIMVMYVALTGSWESLLEWFDSLYNMPGTWKTYLMIFIVAFGITPAISLTVKPRPGDAPIYAFLLVFIASRIAFPGAPLPIFYQGGVFAFALLCGRRPRSLYPAILVNLVLLYTCAFTELPVIITKWIFN